MRTRLFVAALLSIPLATALHQPRAQAAPSADDQKMVAAVAARIFAEAAPVEGWVWPPLVAISDKQEVNAFATVYQVKPGETPELKDEGTILWITLPEITFATGDDAIHGVAAPLSTAAGSGEAKPPAPGELIKGEDGTVTQPIIVLYQGFLDKVVKGNPDRLAAVFGHETSHILLHHVDNVLPGAPLVANMINRDQESAADVLGMKLGLAAGFPYKGLISGILAMRDQGNYNSFEGLNYTHPGWTDRVAAIDEKQSELWHSISAFENGVYFLMTEQYQLAEDCFLQVTKECPKCYEAWANLGYARLMRYCDKLDVSDLRDFDMGQLVVGGFYSRPESLEPPRRGKDDKLWFDAVGALRQAIILNPDLVLAKANLAAAYLVGPDDGRDVGQAEELFAQVTAALKSGAVENLDPLVRASLLINAGVSQMTAGNAKAAEDLFAQAQKLFSAGGPDARATSNALASAVHYNRGRMYASASNAAQRKTAIEELEAYLSSSSSAANWWPLAFELYVKLCKEQGVEPKGQDALNLAGNKQYRMVTGITLANGDVITINESIDALVKQLGEGRKQDVVKGSNVRRLQYSDLGLEVLAANNVVAIRLKGPKAPAVVIKTSGPGGESHEVRTGMTVDELDALMGGDAKNWDQRYGTNTQIVYRFYTRLGFGVRIADGKIMEIIVAQIPVEAKV